MRSADTAPQPSTLAFTVPPVRKAVHLKCTVEEAFVRFTRDIYRWWPYRSHSVGGENVTLVAIEGCVGGRIFEREQDGQEHVWGEILEWNPPVGLLFTWHAGHSPQQAQRIAVQFIAQEGGGTRVTLEHSGWEVLAERAQAARDEYDSGWQDVLGSHFAGYADQPPK